MCTGAEMPVFNSRLRNPKNTRLDVQSTSKNDGRDVFARPCCGSPIKLLVCETYSCLFLAEDCAVRSPRVRSDLASPERYIVSSTGFLGDHFSLLQRGPLLEHPCRSVQKEPRTAADSRIQIVLAAATVPLSRLGHLLFQLRALKTIDQFSPIGSILGQWARAHHTSPGEIKPALRFRAPPLSGRSELTEAERQDQISSPDPASLQKTSKQDRS